MPTNGSKHSLLRHILQDIGRRLATISEDQVVMLAAVDR